jgi:hypothetical protein
MSEPSFVGDDEKPDPPGRNSASDDPGTTGGSVNIEDLLTDEDALDLA